MSYCCGRLGFQTLFGNRPVLSSLKRILHSDLGIFKRNSWKTCRYYTSSAVPALKISQKKMSEHFYPNNQPVVLLDCEKAFSALTEKEKLYAHHLSCASWYGGLIVLLQTSPESPLIFSLLKKLFQAETIPELKKKALAECDFTEDDFTALLVYTSGVMTNMGNYKGFGDIKFVPNLLQEKFVKLVNTSKAASVEPKEIQNLLNNCVEKMFSLQDHEKLLGFPDEGVTTYFSSNCTKDDAENVKDFLKAQGLEAWNTRVFKTVDENGKSCYEIRLASVVSNEDVEDGHLISSHEANHHKFSITRGDYSPLLKLVNKYLLKAQEYAANENEVQMIENYVHSFRTGSIEAHKDGSKYWVKDVGPVIETYIGFIETYRDPAGARGEFEGFVAIVNKEMSAKFNELVREAEQFIPLLPWPRSYELDKFRRPDFTSLDVLSFACSGVPAGINIPNYNDITQNVGFKNVSLGNVICAHFKEPSPNYLSLDDQKLILKHAISSFEVQVGLHELFGHGSGKLFKRAKDGSFNFKTGEVIDFETGGKVSSWYEPGEMYDSVFGPVSSAYEECRAECVGLFLCSIPDILEIFGMKDAVADEVVYVNYLSMCCKGLAALEMYDPKSGRWLQAHCQARYVILQVLLEAGENFVTIEQVKGEDGNPDLVITMDRAKILTIARDAIGCFLKKLQLYKSTADVTRGKAIFDRYSAVTAEGPHPFLNYREIVMVRKKPRKMYVQANTCLENGKVSLKTYESNHEGLIQSWVERFKDSELGNILEEQWLKDQPHFS